MKPGFGLNRPEPVDKGMESMSNLTAMLARADASEIVEQAAAHAAVEIVQTARANIEREPNNHLARSCAARAAVDLVMAQKTAQHPTLKSEWTFAEILRLLDELYGDPSAQIRLGGQHLGAGFQEPKE